MTRLRVFTEEEKKERNRKNSREFHKNNRETVLIKAKERRQLNKEKYKAREALYREKNREALRIRSSEWYHKDTEKLIRLNPKKLMLRRIKNSSKNRGRVCTLTENDFEIPEYCPVLGIKLKFNKGVLQNDSPTFDRNNSDLDYTPGNVTVMSHLANRYKTDMSKEDIGKLYKYVFKDTES